MDITNNGIALIKQFEGCKLAAYQCSAGVWTIGYGHTGRDVHARLTISQDRADALLRQDLQRFVGFVNDLATVDLNNDQFDALVSFAYNCGPANLERSTLLKLVNAGRFDAAAGEFAKWNKAGGKVLPGLVRRRAAEAELFRTGAVKAAA